MDVEIDAEVEKGHRHKRGEELKGRRTQQEVPGEIKLSIALVGRDNAVADDRFPEDDGRAVKEEGQHPHRHHLENSLVGHVPLSSVFNLCQKRGTSMTHSDVLWTETLHHNNTARYISNTHSCSEYLPQMNPLLHCAALEQERDAVNKTHSWSFYTTVCLRSQREKGNVRLTATFTDATLVWKRHLVSPDLPLPHRRLFSLLSLHFHFTSSRSKCYHFAGLLYLLLSPLVLLLFSQSFLFLTQSECLSADSTAGYMSSEAASMSVVQEQLEKKSVVKQIQYKMLINNYGPSFKCSLQKHKTPYFHCKLKKYCTLQAECEETDQ